MRSRKLLAYAIFTTLALYADPTIQARNLFHTSIALYDAWAVYGDGPEQTYLLGQTVGGFTVPFAGVPRPDDVEAARRQAMSYAAYRLIKHRFANSPGSMTIFSPIDVLMADLGYDPAFISTDYADGNPAALGNYIAQNLIQFGLQDGSNEQFAYSNRFYEPFNPSLYPNLPGPNGLIDPNFWQPLYHMLEGGDASQGHPLNPHTGQPYEEQWVPRADYARVVAEFWADGPSTETPPGHWFTILNYVSDHPLFEKRFRGEGPILDDLEWDVKAYFALGGAMHDAAVTAWSIKCWYDYVRPISAIRWLTDRGQSSDPNLPSYDPAGTMLIEGHIELVQAGDPLAGENGEHIGKIKLKSWRGPTYIADPATDIAGVGWILAENWWPYQRSNFVTPPFAGYVSGHSTFASAAAEILTLLTGDPFFPGGLGEFRVERNRFLVFEEGPSVNVVLQWA